MSLPVWKWLLLRCVRMKSGLPCWDMLLPVPPDASCPIGFAVLAGGHGTLRNAVPRSAQHDAEVVLDERFSKAMALTGEEFTETVQHYAKVGRVLCSVVGRGSCGEWRSLNCYGAAGGEFTEEVCNMLPRAAFRPCALLSSGPCPSMN